MATPLDHSGTIGSLIGAHAHLPGDPGPDLELAGDRGGTIRVVGLGGDAAVVGLRAEEFGAHVVLQQRALLLDFGVAVTDGSDVADAIVRVAILGNRALAGGVALNEIRRDREVAAQVAAVAHLTNGDVLALGLHDAKDVAPLGLHRVRVVHPQGDPRARDGVEPLGVVVDIDTGDIHQLGEELEREILRGLIPLPRPGGDEESVAGGLRA